MRLTSPHGIERSRHGERRPAEVGTEVRQPAGQVLQVLVEVVHLATSGVQRHLGHLAHLLPGLAGECEDGHLAVVDLECVDGVERREVRTGGSRGSHGRHLQHTDGRVLDAAELVIDEARQLLVDRAVAEVQPVQDLGDAVCRGGSDEGQLHQRFARHQHDRDERVHAEQVERLAQSVLVLERLADGRQCTDGNRMCHVEHLFRGVSNR